MNRTGVRDADILLWLAGELSELPTDVGTRDGRVDLSGFNGPRGARYLASHGSRWKWTSPWLKRRTWEGIDFSGAVLTGVNMLRSVIRDCVFRDADLRNVVWSSTRVVDCDFAGADLRQTTLAYRTQYFSKPCEFVRCNLEFRRWTDADLSNVTFVECRFKVKTCRSVFMRYCQFLGCSFEGDMEFIFDSELKKQNRWNRTYFGRPLFPTFVDADFRLAKLSSMDFRGCVFEGDLKLPEGIRVMRWNEHGPTISYAQVYVVRPDPLHPGADGKVLPYLNDEFWGDIAPSPYTQSMITFLVLSNPVNKNAMHLMEIVPEPEGQGMEEAIERLAGIARQYGLNEPEIIET